MRADVRDMLHKAGFTDIRIAPSSFAIRAKDKDGNPVMMSVSPDSFTEISEVDNGNADNTAGGASPSGASEFVAINTGDELSSNVVGLDVYNDANKNIGQIKDIAWNRAAAPKPTSFRWAAFSASASATSPSTRTTSR